ncbi:flagellar assembly protein FliW [Proteinivorax tanatarense]|uniref:Flagellar assembly factor FliW n=1 Tax=Proteinivorax tanatarense TaxID=1260629 RepID=A0AAU7VN37_9FIRM
MEAAQKIREQTIINFPKGLLGFEHLKEYIILEEPGSEGIFYWLQSCQESTVEFLVTRPQLFVNYKVNVELEQLEDIGVTKPDQVETLSIVNLPQDITKATVNLRAPVIINHQTLQGKQLVLNDEKLSIKYPLYKKELK